MTLKVLVVDDHPMMRAALRTALETLSEEVMVLLAASLQDAFRQLATQAQPDLVLLDLNLPDACGTATIGAFRSRAPATRVVAFSGVYDATTVQACQAAGAVGFIPKSYTLDQLLNTIRRAVAGQTAFPEFNPRGGAGGLIGAAASIHPEHPGNPAGPDGSNVPDSTPGRVGAPEVRDVHQALLPMLAPLGSQGPRPGFFLPAGQAPAREYSDGRHLGLTQRQRGVLRLMLLGLPNKGICRELDLAEGTVKVHVSAILRALGVATRAQVVVAATRSGIRVEEIR